MILNPILGSTGKWSLIVPHMICRNGLKMLGGEINVVFLEIFETGKLQVLSHKS